VLGYDLCSLANPSRYQLTTTMSGSSGCSTVLKVSMVYSVVITWATPERRVLAVDCLRLDFALVRCLAYLDSLV